MRLQRGERSAFETDCSYYVSGVRVRVCVCVCEDCQFEIVWETVISDLITQTCNAEREIHAWSIYFYNILPDRSVKVVSLTQGRFRVI